MVNSHKKGWKRQVFCILLLFIIILELNLFVFYVLAKKKDISGYSAEDKLEPDESITYQFSNNVKFKISTDVDTDFKIEYGKNIENREAALSISNDDPISVRIKSK